MRVQHSVTADAAAEIHPEWLYFINGVTNIIFPDTAGQENRDTGLFYDAPADGPVVHPPCTTEFLHGQGRISAIEQERIYGTATDSASSNDASPVTWIT